MERGESESERGGCWALKASSCPETLHRSLPFLQTAEKPSLQGGERDRQTHTRTCVTPASGVCHECIIVCYFTATAEVLWLLLKSLWAAFFTTDVWKFSDKWGIAKLMTELAFSLSLSLSLSYLRGAKVCVLSFNSFLFRVTVPCLIVS